jgi:uncharacterized protein with HEPN domain
MSKRGDQDLQADVREAIENIQQYIAGYSYEGFCQDKKTQDAVVRNLEIIGEAAKQISPALRKQLVSIPWKAMAGVRDRLIHHYFGVNYEIVWQIITTELPESLRLLQEARDRPQ